MALRERGCFFTDRLHQQSELNINCKAVLNSEQEEGPNSNWAVTSMLNNQEGPAFEGAFKLLQSNYISPTRIIGYFVKYFSPGTKSIRTRLEFMY